MFLLMNAITASLDGLIIGISLQLSKMKLTKKNIFTIFIGNAIIYTFFLFLYYYFKCTFMTKTFSTIIYIFLGWRALKEENKNYNHHLTFLECILLAITHSLDGTLISLNFVYTYSLFYIIAIFSFFSIIILLIGYYFAIFFKNNKNNSKISASLFFILALLNQFF